MKLKPLFAALSILMLCQCSQPAGNSSDNSNQAAMPTSGLKIAYVNVDSLLSNYNFYIDLNDELMRKEENYRLVLAEEAGKLEKEVEDFRKKVQNNVYSSQERAQSEQNRLAKKEQALNEKSNQFSNELNLENLNNQQKVSEAIDNYIKEYNKEHGYNLIITKAAMLFADESLDITADILDGLNAAYKPENE